MASREEGKNYDYFQPAERRDYRDSRPSYRGRDDGPRRDYQGGRRFQDDNRDRGYNNGPRDYRNDRDRNFGGARPGRFMPGERDDLRRFIQEVGTDWREIARRLRKTPYDCMRQWLFWDSEPDWQEADATQVAELYDSGKSCNEISAQLGTRTPLGIWAKLQVLQKQHTFQRPLESLEVVDAPALIKFVADCEKLIDAGKQLGSGEATLDQL